MDGKRHRAGGVLMSDQRLLSELARAKATFQLRAILAHMNTNTLPPHPTADRDGGCEARAASNVNAVAGQGYIKAVKPENVATCRSCERITCGCPDAIYAGVVPGGSK